MITLTRLSPIFLAASSAALILSSSVGAAPVPKITSPVRGTKTNGHNLRIDVSCANIPNIQSVVVHANGRPIKAATLSNLLTDWTFSNGGHLSLAPTTDGGFTGEVRNSPTSATYQFQGTAENLSYYTNSIRLRGSGYRMANGVPTSQKYSISATLRLTPRRSVIFNMTLRSSTGPRSRIPMAQAGCHPSNADFHAIWMMPPAGPTTLTAVTTYLDSEGTTRTATSNAVRFRVVGEPVIEITGPNRTPIKRKNNLIGFDWLEVGRRAPAKRFVITNRGNAPLELGKIRLTGPAAKDFRRNRPSPSVIQPGKRAILKIAFAPQAIGRRNATLRIASNAPGPTKDLRLSGRGVRSEP